MVNKTTKTERDAEKFIDEAISEIKPWDKRGVTSMVPEAAMKKTPVMCQACNKREADPIFSGSDLAIEHGVRELCEQCAEQLGEEDDEEDGADEEVH